MSKGNHYHLFQREVYSSQVRFILSAPFHADVCVALITSDCVGLLNQCLVDC
jgi:hypothetical protein